MADAVFQTLPSYESPMVPPDISPDAPSFGWRLVNEAPQVPSNIDEIYSDGLVDYTDADKPTYTPTYSGIVEKKRSRWVRFKIDTESGHGGLLPIVYYDEYFISEEI